MPTKRQFFLVAIIVLCMLFASVGCTKAWDSGGKVAQSLTGQDSKQNFAEDEPESAVSSVTNIKKLRVHFIDVGQADAMLIQTPEGKNMLVDAGNNGDKNLLLKYLRNEGVKKLEAVIGTHPHEDHIGALDAVILNIPVQKVYLPDVVHSSQSFEDLLKAIKAKKLKITKAQAGIKVNMEQQVTMEMVAPNSTEYDKLNNYSVVLKITYGRTSFLLAGDAESASESEMLERNYNLKANVLKVGHHGSNGSTEREFLQAVRPDYAVISVGKGNEYGHPHRETLARLKKSGARILRTDQLGHIVISSDGDKLEVKSQK